MTETLDQETYKKYKRAAQIINGAGGTPFPISDTLITILKHIVPDEEDLAFIKFFKRKTSQTMEQLKETSNLSEEEILRNVKKLAKIGLIFNQPNRHGLMVYRLMPFIDVGVFEYTFMGALENNEENRELARLFQKLTTDVKDKLKQDYDVLLGFLKNRSPVDRTIPFTENKTTGAEIEIIVDLSLDVPEEQILPVQKVEELLEKFDDIAVGHCFCRHHHDLLGDPCKQTDIRENCFTFGKSARFTAEQGFTRLISKDEALDIIRRSDEDGLVHKAYHPHFDATKDETSLCICCNCCCGQAGSETFNVNKTHYIARVDQKACTGCGICVENCHTGTMYLNDDNIAYIGDLCIGCGVCAHFCPEQAISLKENERIVRFAPPRPE
jgi:NAD-dependent dihydropyrimidine dehydrogenase PreA subunit/predicted transcriptional regulator